VSRWRSGFHAIAAGAGVPILPVAFDYWERVIHLLPVYRPGRSLEEDLPRIQALFSRIHGLRERPGAEGS